MEQFEPLGGDSILSWVAPVTLPPGRLRLVTRPSRTGSPAVVNTMGVVVLARPQRSGLLGDDDFHLEADEVGD